ncbi:poly [ADP-ribose] polymerase 12-like [Sinocyclocheilus grahami]|uniref:poly [ADP-ribose] polymerase 12-like n=1 Tax=Sinocyclocheilus grahami TaxID=75366 RepID=UPI0007AC6D2C|nr:PREDICTED: poly [ADP-ribose] polymerase 12-like [Sinocyclocheilus grahami]
MYFVKGHCKHGGKSGVLLRPNAAGPNPRRGPNAQNRRPSSGFNAGRGQGAQRPPQNNTEKTEICMYFVKGHCKHGGSCWKEHSTLPYKWEVKEGSEWKALPDNEAIEKDYCDAARTYSSGMNPVYFDTMTQGCYSVRRLSTVPSVLQPTFILTTEWIWYWEDEYGNWIQYATADGGHGLSSISSAELEQKFQADSNAVVEFTAGSQTYELSFTDMIQTNKRYTTKKIIRRRPKFVSAADVRTIKTTKRTPNNFKALPEHWDKALTPETGYKSVSLQSTSAEHIKIKELFSRTMFGFRILKIQRIQNKALWEVYQWQKDFMKKNNGGRDVTEKQLFHGTDSTHLDAICHNNFDWRICGTHGTAYGKGSYFARDAKYSHGYTKDSGTRSMFVCRILVGSYTKGESSYLRPPSKDGGDTVFYDSCVNDVFDPSIFVVFEKHQIYPEYLIEYRDVGGFDSPSRPAVANPAVAVRSRVAVPVVTRHIPSTNASSSYSSSSNNPFYKPSSAARRHYTASYISSSSASSSSSSRSYFARDAKYSHGYTKDSGTRSMFVCRILVGSYTKGESSYLRPPSKDGGDTVFYDSCVNDVFDPSIFVVFEKHQIYPEYLIEYRDVGGFDSPSRPAVANPAVAVRSRVAVPVVTRHIPSTNASSSYSSSSNNPFYKPSSAASSSYTASYISSSSASSSSSSLSLLHFLSQLRTFPLHFLSQLKVSLLHFLSQLRTFPLHFLSQLKVSLLHFLSPCPH